MQNAQAPGDQMSNPERPLSIFISYTRDDAAYAKRLYQHLMDFRGRPSASVFLDQQRIEAGEFWSDAIERAVADTELFVLLLSANFLASRYCIETETVKALQAMTQRGKRIFVVLVGTCIYDAVPHGAPSGRVLGEVATQTVKTIARDLQAAGPFDEQGRLVAMDGLSPPRQDLAWEAVVGQIYRHFNLARPTSDAADAPAAADPDRDALLARCDRKPMLDLLEKLSRGEAPALVVCTGHRLDLSLFRRLRDDLRALPDRPIQADCLYLKKAERADSADDFERLLVRHANTGEPDPRRMDAAGVLAWAQGNRASVLLLGMAVVGANEGERLQAGTATLHAAHAWLARQRLNGLQVIVVVGIESTPVDAARGLGKAWSWLRGDLTAKVRRVMSALPPTLQREALVLESFVADHVKGWIEDEQVHQMLLRRPRLELTLMQQLRLRDRWQPAELLELLLMETSHDQP